jgi:N-acetylglucosamine-6-phosphate deacetylase
MEDYAAAVGTAREDLSGRLVCPGYIDIHNHGALNHDVMEGSAAALDAMARFHFEHGVSAFLASTLSAPWEQLEAVIESLERYEAPVPVGFLGLHLEGPYLSPKNAGAHPRRFLDCPGPKGYNCIERHGSLIRLITLAPDLNGIPAFIRRCVEQGIVVFGGHDAAIAPEVHAAVEAGMRGVTHIYCCSSLTSRKDIRKYAGLTEIALTNPRLIVEVIADGWHITEDLFRLIYACKGFRGICLVSDCIRAAGLSPGNYILGNGKDGVPVEVGDGIALLPDHSAFAGSITPVAAMVERLTAEYGVPVEEAAAMVTEVPSTILGLPDKGRIEKGYEARLNILDSRGRLTGIIAEEQIIHPGEEVHGNV